MDFLKKMQSMIYNTDSEVEDETDTYGGDIYGDAEQDPRALGTNNATRSFSDNISAEDIRSSSNVSVTSGSSIEMKVIRPEKLDSVTQIADYLTSGNTVLLNLEATNKETARRLLDFLNGVAYAVGGKLKKVANSTFVITPANVSISGGQTSDTSDHDSI
ncbi:MAG: cell division protein SepF [Clostridia bacterium]|nr:cell division protein SepF [Clostridia bacterium]